MIGEERGWQFIGEGGSWIVQGHRNRFMPKLSFAVAADGRYLLFAAGHGG
jgi:hypothetical protein